MLVSIFSHNNSILTPYFVLANMKMFVDQIRNVRDAMRLVNRVKDFKVVLF